MVNKSYTIQNKTNRLSSKFHLLKAKISLESKHSSLPFPPIPFLMPLEDRILEPTEPPTETAPLTLEDAIIQRNNRRMQRVRQILAYYQQFQIILPSLLALNSVMRGALMGPINELLVVLNQTTVSCPLRSPPFLFLLAIKRNS